MARQRTPACPVTEGRFRCGGRLPPFGTADEEYYSGMRAMRQWKDYFGVKRDYTGKKSVL